MGSLLVCAVAAATLHACAMQDEPRQSESTSAASICAVRNAGDPWWAAGFPQQTGQFHVLVRSTPQANNMDAVIGISQNGPSTWSDLAAIVRFAPSGRIDVRNGGAYTADVDMPYVANTTYVIRFDIDIATHTYSVRARPAYSSTFTTIATSYAFRTEQTNVSSLAAAGVLVDTTAPGSIEVCDLEALADDTTPEGCLVSTPESSFQSAWFGPLYNGTITQFVATPSTGSVDGVIGYTLDPADSFSDYIASVRFSTAGVIEARDGDVYRATNAMPYVAGRTYHFYVIMDFTTKRYSVYAGDPLDVNAHTVIADNFRFRTQQMNADASLYLASIVDSPEGEVRTCGFHKTSPDNMVRVRTGNYRLAAFRDAGRILLSSGGTAQVLDNTGATLATGALPFGPTTVDADGNIFVATSDYTAATVTLTSVTSTLGPRWTRTYAGARWVSSIGAYDSGDIALAVSGPDEPVRLLTVRPDGSEGSIIELGAVHAVAIGRDRFATSELSGGSFAVKMHAPDGTLLWQRSWTGYAHANDMVVEPNGSLVFAGDFGGTGIDFGAGFYESFSGPEFSVNGYMVALTNTGALRFAHRYFEPGPTSVSSSGDIMSIATTRWSQMPHPQLWVYTRDGQELHAGTLSLVNDAMGTIDQTIVDSEGRVIANTTLKLHPSNVPPRWPVLATFVF